MEGRIAGRMAACSLVLAMSGCATAPKDEPAVAAQAAPQRKQALTTEQLEESQRTVNLGMRGVESCYEEEMGRQDGKKFTAQLILQVLVAKQGSVRDVEVKGNSPSEAMRHCIEAKVRSWEFPALNEATWLTYPVELSPQY